MRPLRLDLAGFTVFRDETTVDFTDADYFALVGPTGSGKSTVLDGICFALYGSVPRWGGSRGIGNALAPSATEARVRLVFESAGSRYVATRVVRRDGRGNVKTAGAGLQLMPPGFDVTRLDTGMSLDDLGEVLAGTPAEMDQAVTEAVGLPYEQFTSCVILPQGQFADFLHAKPATRQQILVNLLGLHVYEEVQALAATRAATAEGRLATVDQFLAGLADADDAAFDRHVAVNLKGTFNTLREAARRLRDGGRIVNLSSSVTTLLQPTYGVYAATKAGVEAMTGVLAKELRGRGITVNAVAPGPTATPLFLDGKPQELVDRMAKAAPLERLGRPEDIAAAVAFLAGPDGGWVNGQVLRANGGLV